jgi:hypothetical protein
LINYYWLVDYSNRYLIIACLSARVKQAIKSKTLKLGIVWLIGLVPLRLLGNKWRLTRLGLSGGMDCPGRIGFLFYTVA